MSYPVLQPPSYAPSVIPKGMDIISFLYIFPEIYYAHTLVNHFTPINKVWENLFLHTINNTIYCQTFSFLPIWWKIMSLICTYLIMSDGDHIFKYLRAIFIAYSPNSIPFANFRIPTKIVLEPIDRGKLVYYFYQKQYYPAYSNPLIHLI